MINFIPLGLRQLKKKFALGVMNFRTLIKTLRLSELQILESRIFHSLIVAGKKEFLKYSWIVLHSGIVEELYLNIGWIYYRK